MLLDLRPVARLRGPKAVDVVAALGPVVDAVGASELDLADVRVVCDWIQYKSNFRNAVDVRRILPLPPRRGDVAERAADAQRCRFELAVDLRRAANLDADDIRQIASEALKMELAGEAPGILLEDWCPTSTSCLSDFNALYWRALEFWEKSTGRQYEQALPGGQSDARNTDAVRELIDDLFTVWRGLEQRHALPDELYVVELGVGNGNQAKVWLDEFKAMDLERGTDYYRRLHYLMCDYSPHVLALARETVAEHAEHVSSFVLDATSPSVALSFLQYKVFLVYVSNVYDNLPSDEVATIGGAPHLVESRAYLLPESADKLAASAGIPAGELPPLIRRLLRLGPELTAEAAPDRFDSVDAAVEFWRRTWDAVRLQERYVPIRGLDVYEIAPGVSGEMLRPQLESGDDLRLHVNNGAVASFVDTLRLLHPYGKLISHDLFVEDTDGYRSGFRGPGKYDGSVVNWVNGRLLAHIGRRSGHDVTFRPFSHRVGTNVVTLSAQARD